METGIRKTLKGYQPWFKIGNQTFQLAECIEDTKKESKEVAEFYKRMLIVAFKSINVKIKE